MPALGVRVALPQADAVLTDDRVPETEKLSELPGRHLSTEWAIDFSRKPAPVLPRGLRDRRRACFPAAGASLAGTQVRVASPQQQTCAKIPKRSQILEPQDPGIEILEDLGS